MDTHKNAPLTPKGREAMVRCVKAGLSNAAAARQFNTTPKTVAKWVERFHAGGVDALRDRSSRPLSFAKPNSACHMRGGRGIAAPAPHRQANRGRSPRVGCHR
jgi:hypothetical protein